LEPDTAFASGGLRYAAAVIVAVFDRIERSEIGSPGEFDHLSDDELYRSLVERFERLKLEISDGSAALNGVSAQPISSRRAGAAYEGGTTGLAGRLVLITKHVVA
jgi:hypothetical protein